MEMTRHAQARAQQRAIPAEIFDLLLTFGTEMRHRGADVVCFDRASRRRLQSSIDAPPCAVSAGAASMSTPCSATAAG